MAALALIAASPVNFRQLVRGEVAPLTGIHTHRSDSM